MVHGRATSIVEPPNPTFLSDVRMGEVHTSFEALQSTAKLAGTYFRPSDRVPVTQTLGR